MLIALAQLLAGAAIALVFAWFARMAAFQLSAPPADGRWATLRYVGAVITGLLFITAGLTAALGVLKAISLFV
jgi:hypothetical protein